MCNQAVGLIQAAIERRGIPTASITLLRYVTERVRPPRALAVPFTHGYPLDRPGDPAAQGRVVDALLALLGHPGPPPVLVEL
jgi:hypothetical protein